MKDILVFLSPSARNDSLSGGARYAIALARMRGAHLSALIEETEADLYDLPTEPDIRQVEKATTRPALPAERVARTAELVQSAAADAKLSCDVLGTDDQSVSLRERIIHCTQVHDILIVDVRGPL